MKIVHLFHNPLAGNKRHSKEWLISNLEQRGCKIFYSDTTAGIHPIQSQTELIVIAGGDGTVRQVVEEIINGNSLLDGQVLTILPLGTSNNIAATLGINDGFDTIFDAWANGTVIPFNISKVEYEDKVNFFIKAAGFGLFPFHQQQLNSNTLPGETKEEKITRELALLLESLKKIVPVAYDIMVDGNFFSGEYIMVEVMNIRSISGRLAISPRSQPSDDLVELVLVTEEEKPMLSEYLFQKIMKNDLKPSFRTIRGKEILLKTTFSEFQLDDELIQTQPSSTVTISSNFRTLPFLIP